MSNDCSTESLLSQNVTISYGVIYSLFLVIVSIYSFNFLMKYDKKFINSSSIKKVKIWAWDVWKRRRCYVPIVVHIFDQLTDVSVAIQFYILAQQQDDDAYHTHIVSCGGLNMWYLFILTILAMVIYRSVSSYLIYQSTKSMARFFSQLLDLELLRALYINYLCNKNEPCDPQRWITALEASLESSPQSLIQIIYLVKTGTFNSSYLVVISLISSLWSIVSKLISDDKVIVIENAQNANFKLKKNTICDIMILFILVPILLVLNIIYAIIIITIFVPLVFVFYIICCPCCVCRHYAVLYEYIPTIDDMFDVMFGFGGTTKMKFARLCKPLLLGINKHNKWISWLYVLRFMWRIFDVTSHLLLMTLIWIVIGGTALTIKVSVELLSLLIICIITKQWELLFAIIALVISTTTNQLRKMSIGIGVYRTCTNIIFMILISVWFYIDFECWRCTDYTERQTLVDDVYVFGIFIYSWSTIILSPICMYILIKYDALKSKSSTSRQLEKMIISNNYDGILEIQLYSSKYKIYDPKTQKTLLMLAISQNKPAIVAYLLNKLDKYDQTDIEERNAFDYYMMSFYHYEDYTKMTKNLVEIHKKHPNIRSVTGCTILLWSCIQGNLQYIEKLIGLDAKLVNETTNDGLSGATLAKIFGHQPVVNYFEQTHNIHSEYNGDLNILDWIDQNGISGSTLLYHIYLKNRNVRSLETKYTVFLYACQQGNLSLVKQLIFVDESVLKDQADGLNGANVAEINNHSEIVNYLAVNHKLFTMKNEYSGSFAKFQQHYDIVDYVKANNKQEMIDDVEININKPYDGKALTILSTE